MNHVFLYEKNKMGFGLRENFNWFEVKSEMEGAFVWRHVRVSGTFLCSDTNWIKFIILDILKLIDLKIPLLMIQ